MSYIHRSKSKKEPKKHKTHKKKKKIKNFGKFYTFSLKNCKLRYCPICRRDIDWRLFQKECGAQNLAFWWGKAPSVMVTVPEYQMFYFTWITATILHPLILKSSGWNYLSKVLVHEKFTRETVFSVFWLYFLLQRKIFFSDLTSQQSRDLFKEFIKEWNEQALPKVCTKIVVAYPIPPLSLSLSEILQRSSECHFGAWKTDWSCLEGV